MVQAAIAGSTVEAAGKKCRGFGSAVTVQGPGAFVLVMLLGAMPDESAAGLLLPTAKTRATDFSIAAIMARGDEACPVGLPSPPREVHEDG